MADHAPSTLDLARRARRNRVNPAIRAAVRENQVLPQHLVLPMFVQEGAGVATPISCEYPRLQSIHRAALENRANQVLVNNGNTDRCVA